MKLTFIRGVLNLVGQPTWLREEAEVVIGLEEEDVVVFDNNKFELRPLLVPLQTVRVVLTFPTKGLQLMKQTT
jgi:hypothetical protein